MMILVEGINGSGKSRYAEKLVAALGETRYYIATMRPVGQAGADRVRKHIDQRAQYGFTTLECPVSLAGAEIPPEAVVLLEDVSNLLANGMFEQNRTAQDTLAEIDALCARVKAVVAVTISAFDAGDYDADTQQYIRAMDALNRALSERADTVVELVNGQPVCRKGTAYELD